MPTLVVPGDAPIGRSRWPLAFEASPDANRPVASSLPLFYLQCYKFIFAYMGFAVFNIFFFITGAVFIQVMQVGALQLVPLVIKVVRGGFI